MPSAAQAILRDHDSMHERDQAGSLHFANGSGQIKAMISMPDALWVFKRDGAYRTTLPDQIDPGRTNPNLPVQKHWYPELGTADPCVARLFIQPMQMLHELDARDLDEPKGFKNMLLETCKTMQAVGKRLDGFSAIMATLTVAEDQKQHGSFPAVEIPGVAQTSAVVEEVLGNLKRVSQAALNCPHYLLGTTYWGNPNFDKAHKELKDKYGESEGIARIIAIHRDALVEMIDMRNAIEHPREGQRVSITEVRIGASGKLEEPKIIFEHKGITKEFSMLGYLYDVAARVFNLTEELFVCCVEQKEIGCFPFVVVEIKQDKIDAECPTKYAGSFQPHRPPAL